MSARSDLHEWVANVKCAIEGDEAAARRYADLGRPDDAKASRESATWWREQISRRLSGLSYHGQQKRRRWA